MTSVINFYAVKGLPISKISQYDNASTYQKRYAHLFDADNNGIFDQNEADLFNATTFRQEQDGSVTFCTRVRRKWSFFKKEIIETNFKNNDDIIKYSKSNGLKGRTIMPYKETHYDIPELPLGYYDSKIKGIVFKHNSAVSYSEIYYNDQYMNRVKLEDGTSIIYPDGQDGSVEVYKELRYYEREYTGLVLKYDFYTQNNKTVKDSDSNPLDASHVYTGNQYTKFNQINNAIIIGSDRTNEYELNGCRNCVVDNTNFDNNSDKVYIKSNSNSSDIKVMQNEEDLTVLQIKNKRRNNYEKISGKKEININDYISGK